MARRTAWAGAGLLLTLAAADAARAAPDLSLSADLATDHRRRGLSWSQGRAAAEVSAAVTLPGGVSLGAGAATLRGSARHGGADAVIDGSLTYRHDGGAWHADAGLFGHTFAGGRGSLDYAEIGGGVGTLIGPASVDALIRYAPDQKAIGGDNLYVGAQARGALIGTPFTLLAGIGRSTGGSDGSGRSARLRPAGDYTDWTIGIDHVRGPFVVGVAYVGTDVSTGGRNDRALRHAGDRIVAHAGISW